LPRRWLTVALAAALAGPATATAAPAAEGPAPPPGPRDSKPVPKDSKPGPKDSKDRPDPKASSPVPKDSPTVEGPAPPPPRGAPEGPAQLPGVTGARATSERPWLREGPQEPEPAEGKPGSLGLTRQRDGSVLFVDPGKRFTAAVNPDGSVRFGNRWGRDQHGERMRGSGRALRQIGPSGIGAVGGIGITGPTEWLLALQGQERDAAAKTAFLNQTRELRIQLAVEFTLRLLDTRLGELNQELLGLTADASRDLATRRALLFQRWDECDERLDQGLPADPELPGEAVSMIDEARLAAADRARRTIEAFIRRQLPRGSARAFTAAELADFNRRRVSVETFDPYTPRPARPAAPPASPAPGAP